jgi:hypothetical protein
MKYRGLAIECCIVDNQSEFCIIYYMFLSRLFGRRYRLQRLALLCFIGGLLVYIAYSIHNKSASGKKDSSAATGEMAQLPPDVEFVLKDFNYNESSDKGSIEISGKLSAMRGRKVMVFRSNLAKATYFELLKGTIRSSRHTITFSADYGEWDNQKSTPFVMTRNVRLIVDNKQVRDVETLRLDMAGQQLIAVGKEKACFAY